MPYKRKKKKNWLAIGLGIGGLAIFCLICAGILVANGPRLYKYALAHTSLAVGKSAPDFSLISLSGESVSLSQFKGQPVMLSFSTSWCPDCNRAAPLLEKVHEEHPELAVLVVDGGETVETVQQSAADHGFTFPVLVDQDNSIDKRFAITAIPTVFFIDSNGVIRAKIIETVTPELLAEALPLIGIEP